MISAIKSLHGQKCLIVFNDNTRVVGIVNFHSESHVEVLTHNHTHHIHPSAITSIREFKE